MANFSIQSGMSQGEIVGAVNYLLSNIGLGLQVNELTGQIYIPNGTVPYAYAYRYIYIAFADSSDGVLNFTQASYTNRQYYGILNTATITPGGSANPADYVWFKVSGAGFSTTRGLYYQIFGQNQVKFEILDLSPDPQGFYSEPYTLRLYQYVDPNQRGIDLIETTNATNIDYAGALSSSPVNIFVIDNVSPNGKPEWLPASQLVVNGADTILVDQDIAGTYYIPLVDQFGGGVYSSVFANIDLNYVEGSPSVLSAPNYETTGTITLAPLTAQPSVFTTGTIAMADAVNWDPATYSTTTPYLSVYNGTNWIALG